MLWKLTSTNCLVFEIRKAHCTTTSTTSTEIASPRDCLLGPCCGNAYTLQLLEDAAQLVHDTGITISERQLETGMNTPRVNSAALSSSLSVVAVRQDFTQQMISTLQTGSDNLTLADMNEEGANMLMLQTRQSLGVTSLSMASQASQSVMRLFS